MAECMLANTPPKPIPWNRMKVYKTHSPNFKKEILEQCNNLSTRKVAELYSINESTIRHWKKKALEPEKSRKEGSGRKPLSVDMEERLFSWITEMRERNLRVTIQSACIQAKVFYKEINPDSSDEFQGSKGWFTRFSNRYNLTIRKKTTQTQRLPSDYIPKLQRFLLYAKDKLENNQYSQIIAYDETAVWYDSVGNMTIEKIGKEDVALASTGHDKQNITVGLAYCSDGTKLKPMVVFKGKGCTQEDKILKSRKDINVVYSDNGWFNADLINDWVNKTLKSTLFGKRLLVWDAYKAHLVDEVKSNLNKKRIDTLVIPGGCTRFLQTLDVSANKPFKSVVQKCYDEWMMNGEKTYTAKGNIRAPTKTNLCDWVLKGWSSLSTDLVKNSFIACGQVKGVNLEDISCLKQGRPCHDGLVSLKPLWDLPINKIDMKNMIELESSCSESEKEPEEEESDIEEENSDEDIIDCELTEQCTQYDNISTTPAPIVPATVKRKLSPILQREVRPRRCKK